MLRIVLDARKHADFGIGTYIRGLLSGFEALASGDRFHLLSPPGLQVPYLPADWSSETVGYRPYGLGEFFAMGSIVRRTSAHVFHAPHYTIPLNPGLPTVVTVHDLIQLRFPEIFTPLQRAYARMMITHSTRKARAVLTPSISTKNDLIERFGIEAGKIHVTPLGVDSRFRPQSNEVKERMRRELRLPSTFVLFLGNPKPHKGLSVLLESYSAIIRESKDLPLVIAGGSEHELTSLRLDIRSRGLDQSVICLGTVSSEAVPALIGNALMVVLPSLWEGFGLPVVEAMACGTPVICTTAGSLSEVSGEAALLTPPGDSESLRHSILRLAGDGDLHESLRMKGLKRSAEFRWERTARVTREVYMSVLT